MYSPSYYREIKTEMIAQLMGQYSFATLLTAGGSHSISHLPMIVGTDLNGKLELISHMARANPHWKELESVGKGKAIFHGPHGYISPAWYAPKSDNVPTWNYAVVHATGNFEIVKDRDSAFGCMNRLVDKFEKAYGTEWTLPADEPAVHELMEHIVVFKITQLEFDSKFKLSQKQENSDRSNVIEQLKELKTESASALATYMEIAK